MKIYDKNEANLFGAGLSIICSKDYLSNFSRAAAMVSLSSVSWALS